MTRDRYKITTNEQPHFVTCTIVNWMPIFTRHEAVRIILDSLAYLQAKEGLTVFGFVIMENHLHLIVSAKDLSDAIRRFKSFTARKIIDFLNERGGKSILEQLSVAKRSHAEHGNEGGPGHGNEGGPGHGNERWKDRKYQFWQKGFHPVLIQNEEIMRQKLEYMHNNPVRRGYVDDPAHWRYSSARNYAGQDGLLEVTKSW